MFTEPSRRGRIPNSDHPRASGSITLRSVDNTARFRLIDAGRGPNGGRRPAGEEAPRCTSARGLSRSLRTLRAPGGSGTNPPRGVVPRHPSVEHGSDVENDDFEPLEEDDDLEDLDEPELDEDDLDDPELDDADLEDGAIDEDAEAADFDGDEPEVESIDELGEAEAEEDDAAAAILLGDLDDAPDLTTDADDDDLDGLRDGEFVCRSCFMAKRESALADPKRMLCRDCA